LYAYYTAGYKEGANREGIFPRFADFAKKVAQTLQKCEKIVYNRETSESPKQACPQGGWRFASAKVDRRVFAEVCKALSALFMIRAAPITGM